MKHKPKTLSAPRAKPKPDEDNLRRMLKTCKQPAEEKRSGSSMKKTEANMEKGHPAYWTCPVCEQTLTDWDNRFRTVTCFHNGQTIVSGPGILDWREYTRDIPIKPEREPTKGDPNAVSGFISGPVGPVSVVTIWLHLRHRSSNGRCCARGRELDRPRPDSRAARASSVTNTRRIPRRRKPPNPTTNT